VRIVPVVLTCARNLDYVERFVSSWCLSDCDRLGPPVILLDVTTSPSLAPAYLELLLRLGPRDIAVHGPVHGMSQGDSVQDAAFAALSLAVRHLRDDERGVLFVEDDIIISSELPARVADLSIDPDAAFYTFYQPGDGYGGGAIPTSIVQSGRFFGTQCILLPTTSARLILDHRAEIERDHPPGYDLRWTRFLVGRGRVAYSSERSLVQHIGVESRLGCMTHRSNTFREELLVPMTTTREIAERMDDAYRGEGQPYTVSLPFDRQRMERIRDAVLELAGEDARDPHKRVLDVGCGLGGVVSYWPHRNIVGLEISAEAVAKARAAFPDATFEVGSIEELPRVGELFDLVCAVESIEHWADAPRGLDAVRSRLRDDGILVLTTPNRDSLHCRIARKLGLEAPYCSSDHVHEFGFDELLRTVTSAGFRLDRSRGVHLAPVWALEGVIGSALRRLTNDDEDVNEWLNAIGASAPPELCFIQCHRFVAT